EMRVVSMSEASLRKMRSQFPSLATDGRGTLSDVELFMFLEQAQGITDFNVMQAPKITMVSGQRVQLAVHDDLVASVSAMVAGNLRHIDLDVKADVQGVKFAKTARLMDGQTLVLPGRTAGGALLMILTPRVIINIEEMATAPPPVPAPAV